METEERRLARDVIGHGSHILLRFLQSKEWIRDINNKPECRMQMKGSIRDTVSTPRGDGGQTASNLENNTNNDLQSTLNESGSASSI